MEVLKFSTTLKRCSSASESIGLCVGGVCTRLWTRVSKCGILGVIPSWVGVPPELCARQLVGHVAVYE